jgi:hypothetical protein
MRHRVLLAAALLLPSLAWADASPYAGQQTRTIKALSDTEIDGLLEGRGMELAKPAELNGYPGPAHALELAADLALSPDQIAALELVRHRMAAGAKTLGAEIVQKERNLDTLFASRSVDAQKLHAATLEIGVLRGRLRAVHLEAHLETTAVLHRDQAHRYDVLRGYSRTPPSADAHHPASGAREHRKH